MKKVTILSIIFTFILTALIYTPTQNTTSISNKISADEITSQTGRLGLAVLALLHKRYPTNEVKKTINSFPNVSIAILYGTFGKDPKNFKTLADTGNLHHTTIYTLCNPCRIPRRNGKLETFYPQLSINQLNRALVSNGLVREAYKRMLLKIRQDFVEPYPNITFDLVPELESSFDVKANTAAINMLTEIFGDLENVTYRNNPLKYSRLIRGIPIEVHTLDLNIVGSLRKNDSISLDGVSASTAAIKSAIKFCKKKNIHFLLWFPEWQGLNGNSHSSALPNERIYKFSYREVRQFFLTYKSN